MEHIFRMSLPCRLPRYMYISSQSAGIFSLFALVTYAHCSSPKQIGKWRKVYSYSTRDPVSPTMTVAELKESIFNVDSHPFDIVFRSVQVSWVSFRLCWSRNCYTCQSVLHIIVLLRARNQPLQIACQGARCECSHGDWVALTTHVDSYLRSPEVLPS